MKQQRIANPKSTKAPQIIDTRQPKLDPQVEASKVPVRTVCYVEVRDMAPAQVQLLIQEINKVYETSRGGIHYAIPIRHGKIGSDMEFEAEFLATVKKICEVKDGEIVLRDGAQECTIVREHIPM